MGKLTTAEKLAEAERLVALYREQRAEEKMRENIEPGDTILFEKGRGENKQILDGEVLGTKTDSNGQWIKVQVGDGFEAETFTIRAAAIRENPAAKARSSAEETAAA